MHAKVARNTGAGEQIDTDAALTALNDERCRRILSETEGKALTAQEISQVCDLPSSTTYRKIDLLTDASLLEERMRLRSDGNHVSEYTCVSTSLTLGFSEDIVEVTLDSPDR